MEGGCGWLYRAGHDGAAAQVGVSRPDDPADRVHIAGRRLPVRDPAVRSVLHVDRALREWKARPGE